MKKTITAAALVALLGAAANANAWWGFPFGGWGPWGNGWDNGWFGDGWMDFNFNISASAHGYGRGWNRYHGYYAPYWGGYGYPYGAYGYPYAAPVAVVPAAPAATADSK